MKPLHPFVTTKITSPVESNNIPNLLASFRASGGRYEKKEILCIQQNVDKPTEPEPQRETEKLDVLDPNNHQRLSVLFCSFSHESPNAPAFCVNPWLVTLIYSVF